MNQQKYSIGHENGRGEYRDYGHSKVPNDEFNDLKIGKGWRKHWTILCPDCLLPSPYVIDLKDVSTLDDMHDGYVKNEWSLECPRCHLKFTWDDEYYED